MDYYVPPKVEHVQQMRSRSDNEKLAYREFSGNCCGGQCKCNSNFCVPEEEKSISQEEKTKATVRNAYSNVAEANNCGKSCGNGKSCCGVPASVDIDYLLSLGYTQEDLDSLPKGSNMGLGCGNPQMMAELKPGEYVLDLGSGGGVDVFLAARKVGPSGKVFGVDMTPTMLQKARLNADQYGYKNVQFLLGEIEHLPLPNQTIDVVISNCVVNLSTDKQQVFSEVYRVLKDGGRIAISDIVAYKPLPAEILNNPQLYCACIAGAMTIDNLKEILLNAGFENVRINVQEDSKKFIKEWALEIGAENYVVSAKITAVKPKK